MSHVQVRLSAELSRLAGRPRVSVELADEATAADLLRRLEDDYPALTPHLSTAILFVRGAHAAPAHALASGDEVALLLPVAGG